MKPLRNLSRNLSDKTYNDLSFPGKMRWKAYGWLAAVVLWWKKWRL